MPFTFGVGSADEFFIAVVVDFEIVGDGFAVGAMTQNQPIRRMVKPKVFHDNPLPNESHARGMAVLVKF